MFNPSNASRTIYLTMSDDDTVTIDYDEEQDLFVTEKERLPFSAEKLFVMLNGWAKVHKVQTTMVGCLHISVDSSAVRARCLLTQRALHTLWQSYQRRRDWQVEFPFVSPLFASYASNVAAF